MKHHLITAIIMAALLSYSSKAYADKINVVNNDGVTIEFNTYDDGTCSFGSVEFPRNFAGHLTIPSTIEYNSKTYSVTKIQKWTFYSCKEITSITIPSSIKYIENYSFVECYNLHSVYIDDLISWMEIEREDFSGIYANPMDFAKHLFLNGQEITELVIPESITEIKGGVFKNCEGLRSVVIPNSVTTISYSAFYGCTNLSTLNIPESVTTINGYAFYKCSNLSDLNLPKSITTIDFSAFYGCSSLTKIEVPSSVSSIGEKAFMNCTSLKEVSLPKNCTELNKGIFNGCTSLEIFTMPEALTAINDSAFKNCSKLKSIIIPSSVTTIGKGAFSGCSALSSITSYITSPFVTGNDAFLGLEDATLYVPKGLVNAYYTRADWNRIYNIEEMPEGLTLNLCCNLKGSVTVNGTTITGKMSEVVLTEGTDNTFTFTPHSGCRLDQVILNGLDITANVEGNTLTCTIPANSQMIVTFTSEQGDMNNDGTIDISDVVAIVNKILGN